MTAWTGWQERGACRGKEPRHWFPVASGNSYRPAKEPQADPYAYARSICADCPVLDECRAYGLAVVRDGIDLHGLFGGLDPHERLRIVGRDRPRAVAS